jgi:hypothetical protein
LCRTAVNVLLRQELSVIPLYEAGSNLDDTVWRLGLWQKLQKSNIQGKIFEVVYNMYQNIKTCIRKGEECSVFFNSEVGVKKNKPVFFQKKNTSLLECKTKILSTVENPLLNPVCAPEISSTSSANKSNIQGTIFKVIYNMYQNIKTCIPKGEECSVFFNSEVGVKQWENMYPFLFSLFLNDLET